MADNTELNSGSGGDTIRTEDRTTFKTPVSLIDVGGTSAESIIGDSGVTMPVGGLVAHDTAVSGNPVLQALEAKDFDGSALPNVVSAEGDSVRAAASLYGVQYVMCVNEDGSTVGSVNAVCTNAGTFAVQAAQTGSWTVDLGATDNAVLDAIAASLAGTLTVGAHAVTNAGTFAVQESGDALTALQLIDDAIYVDDADWTDGVSKHVVIGGLYQSSQQTITDGDVGPLQVDANGNLKVAIISGAGSGGTAAADDADFVAGTTNGTPAMGVYESSPSSVTDGDLGTVGITQTRAMRVSVDNTVTVGSHAVTNAGTFAVQAAQTGTWTVDLGATDNGVLDAIAASLAGTLTVGSHAVTNAGTFAVQVDGSALTALQLLDNTVFVDDAAFTPGTSSLNAVGFLADETATDSVDEGDVGIARMTLDRKVHVAAELETNSMRGSGTALTPKYVIIDCASSGDNTILAAVASKKIRVLSCFLIAAGAVNVRFESGAGGTALTGQMNLTTNSGFVLPFNPVGWFETASNTLLNLELSGATSVDGSLTYVEV